MEQREASSLLVVSNLALVTIGNILGGLVTLVYWFIYLRAEGEGLAGW